MKRFMGTLVGALGDVHFHPSLTSTILDALKDPDVAVYMADAHGGKDEVWLGGAGKSDKITVAVLLQPVLDYPKRFGVQHPVRGFVGQRIGPVSAWRGRGSFLKTWLAFSIDEEFDADTGEGQAFSRVWNVLHLLRTGRVRARETVAEGAS